MLEQDLVSIFGVDERRTRENVAFLATSPLAINDKAGTFDLDVCVTFYGER